MSRSANTIALTMARGVATVSALVIAAVLSRVLDKNDYATYRQTLLVYMMVAPILALGLPASLLYFVSSNPKKKRTIVFEAVAITAITGFIFSLFCIGPGKWWLPEFFNNKLLTSTIPLLGLYAAGRLALGLLEPCLISCGRAPLCAVFSSLIHFAGLGAICSIAVLTSSVFNVVLTQGMIFMLAGVGAVALMHNQTKKETDLSMSLTGISQQLRYAIPLSVAMMLDTLSMSIDKIYISTLRPTEEYAVFVNGAMEIPFIGSLAVAVGTVMLPELVNAFKKNDAEEALNLWKLSIRRLSFVVLPLFFILLTFSRELVLLLYSDKFADSVHPFRIYLFLLPGRAIFFGLLLRSAGCPGLIVRRAILGLIINLVITYPFIIWFGTNGAALATIFSFWVFVIPFSTMLCIKVTATTVKEIFPWAYMGGLLALGATGCAITFLLEGALACLPILTVLVLRALFFCAFFTGGLWVFYRSDLIQFLNFFRKAITFK